MKPIGAPAKSKTVRSLAGRSHWLWLSRIEFFGTTVAVTIKS
jgi:hypothetical protein